MFTELEIRSENGFIAEHLERLLIHFQLNRSRDKKWLEEKGDFF